MTAKEKPGIKSIFEVMDLKDVKFPDSVFKTLNQVNVSKITETKTIGGRALSYLSWADAWTWVKLMYPDASMRVYETPEGSPLFTLNKSGYVKVGITVNGVEHIEMLAVMVANRSMDIAQIQATDVINTIQRCATKAIARHGLGMHVYRGEDIPDDDKTINEKRPETKAAPPTTATKIPTPRSSFVPASEVNPVLADFEFLEYHQKQGGAPSKVIADYLKKFDKATVRRLSDDQRVKVVDAVRTAIELMAEAE